ncbi:TLC domain-containing protein [Stachybotrys elegans]|uniref:TLC domain-containing protein n=1 Tax=Stachybotrys elegans TaxID=80388 RepID=A0A8K0T2L1_9HYPO|nr:TLC domain-containing protein [Stachybotrys elegans]
MKDPFFLEPIPSLSRAVQPFADYFDLPTLPYHIHEILAAALLYGVIYYPISPILSRLVVPNHYGKLSRKSQLNWDTHVVSMVQSVLINALAIWVMIYDEERKSMDLEERVWGYTGAAGLVQSLAAGYFLWDLIVTGLHVDVFGLGTLAHAIAALIVYMLGFRPFVNYYGCIFILWELSTPFLNIHWFLDKLNMTGTRLQLYNGILLLGSFFFARLVYGTYQSVRVFGDIVQTMDRHPSQDKFESPLMLYAHDASTVPVWLGAAYLASNLTLNFLNFYWFNKMIAAIRKRFEPAAKRDTKPAAVVSASSGTSKGSTPRRRKA